MSAKTGLERINHTFAVARQERRAAFMPYHALGYPSRQVTIDAIAALADAGADLFEIGIPHSDPLADGPTVQTATHQALMQGTTVTACLEMVRELTTAASPNPSAA